MARTKYGVYDANHDGTELHLLGEVEASSPAGAVREYFTLGDHVPEHVAVIAASALHTLRAQVETQTRLTLS